MNQVMTVEQVRAAIQANERKAAELADTLAQLRAKWAELVVAADVDGNRKAATQTQDLESVMHTTQLQIERCTIAGDALADRLADAQDREDRARHESDVQHLAGMRADCVAAVDDFTRLYLGAVEAFVRVQETVREENRLRLECDNFARSNGLPLSPGVTLPKFPNPTESHFYSGSPARLRAEFDSK